jgi:hypothetical protein
MYSHGGMILTGENRTTTTVFSTGIIPNLVVE